METDFLASGNHFVSISQIFIINNPLLQQMATDFLFSGNDVFSFPLFWNHQCNYINLISARGNRFLQFFLDTDSNGSSFSVLWNRIFLKESFILASGDGFSINYKLSAFIRSFFLLVEKILKIRYNQFSSIFSNPNSGGSFSS